MGDNQGWQVWRFARSVLRTDSGSSGNAWSPSVLLTFPISPLLSEPYCPAQSFVQVSWAEQHTSP